MLTDQQVEEFQQNGFLNGGPVLSEGEVEELRTELMRVIENQDQLEDRPVRISNLNGKSDAPVWQIVNIWEASEAYRRLMHHPRIVEEIAQLTGSGEVRVWHDQIQYKPAQIGGVNMWHQDAPYWPILVPQEAQVTAWVALDEVDESNGCMSMVPGSHRWGDQIQFLQSLPAFDALPGEFQGEKLTVQRCPVRKGGCTTTMPSPGTARTAIPAAVHGAP